LKALSSTLLLTVPFLLPQTATAAPQALPQSIWTVELLAPAPPADGAAPVTLSGTVPVQVRITEWTARLDTTLVPNGPQRLEVITEDKRAGVAVPFTVDDQAHGGGGGAERTRDLPVRQGDAGRRQPAVVGAGVGQGGGAQGSRGRSGPRQAGRMIRCIPNPGHHPTT
jgi:hypothetical protein